MGQSKSPLVADLLANAERLLKSHRYVEAIEGFGRCLELDPDNLRALVNMGICYLLNGSEQSFRAIHHQAARLVRRLGTLPAGLKALWKRYDAMFHKLSSSALVIGALTVGCHGAAQEPLQTSPPPQQRQQATAASNHEGEVDTPKTEGSGAEVDPESAPDPDLESAFEPVATVDSEDSSEVEGEGEGEGESSPEADLQVLKAQLADIEAREQEQGEGQDQLFESGRLKEPVSAHRYSGGVFLPKRPVPTFDFEPQGATDDDPASGD